MAKQSFSDFRAIEIGIGYIKFSINNHITEDPNFEKLLFNSINTALIFNSKLHINSPTGSGKNTLAIKYIASHPNQDVIYIVPQLAIGAQFITDLAPYNVNVLEYNSNNKKLPPSFKQSSNRLVIVTTLDSYSKIHRKSTWVKNALVFIDETHTAVQSFRNNFSYSLSLLQNSTIIGFSATPSNIVNEQIVKFNETYEVTFHSKRTRKIRPVSIRKDMSKIVALAAIQEAKKGLVVIFLEEIKKMERIQKSIHEYEPNFVVELFNSNNKNTGAWHHLLNHHRIKPGVDIVLINAVATAGVNILNNNIRRIFLVGTFDLFGFVQYLGRVRSYTKYFFYYFYENWGTHANLNNLSVSNKQLASDLAEKINRLHQIAIKNSIKIFNPIMESSEVTISNDKLLIAHELYRQEFSNLDGKFLSSLLRGHSIWTTFKVLKEKKKTLSFYKTVIKTYQTTMKNDIASFIVNSPGDADKLDEFLTWNRSFTWKKIDTRISNTAAVSTVSKIRFTNSSQKESLLKIVNELKSVRKSPRMIKAAIKAARISGNSSVSFQRAELVLKAHHQLSKKYVFAAEFFDTVVVNDLNKVIVHFTPFVNKRKFKDTNEIKAEISKISLSKRTSSRDIYAYVIANIDSKQKLKTVWYVFRLNLTLSDFMTSKNWLADHASI